MQTTVALFCVMLVASEGLQSTGLLLLRLVHKKVCDRTIDLCIKVSTRCAIHRCFKVPTRVSI